ncbi:MAG: hypothetical protein HON94_06270 [Methylococcales bacterium]|nr:hypothetical protein [Methylococcales bacterium]MBT7409546.1 hypothetical protein [Methylococcales bacterium]
MEFVQFRKHYSHNVLIRMILLMITMIVILIWQDSFISEIYFKNQKTDTGLIINGAIISLFLIGFIKMLITLTLYIREENAIIKFLRNYSETPNTPIENIHPKAIISSRYLMMQNLYDKNTQIEHGVLASALIARESTRISLPKFINNILILTGVFGTIVSLSIALLGASDLLDSTTNLGGMGTVIHGMSTALSTTMTAIICYLFFGYCYLKLSDVQTNLISAIEQITTNLLLPQFQVKPESVLYEFSGLIRSLQGLVTQMSKSQNHFEEVETRLMTALESYHNNVKDLSSDMSTIKHLLHEGFRLPDDLRTEIK